MTLRYSVAPFNEDGNIGWAVWDVQECKYVYGRDTFFESSAKAMKVCDSLNRWNNTQLVPAELDGE